eukprot:COSAG06_NODE_1512_length_9233_cov_2.774141_3_plen_46_part_00
MYSSLARYTVVLTAINGAIMQQLCINYALIMHQLYMGKHYSTTTI